MLILTRKTNERIMIGEEIEVSVVEIRGDQVKLGIIAPRNVKVHRREVFEAIQDENRAAAVGTPTDLSQLTGLFPGVADEGGDAPDNDAPDHPDTVGNRGDPDTGGNRGDPDAPDDTPPQS